MVLASSMSTMVYDPVGMGARRLKLRELRQAVGETQASLAEKDAGFSQAAISRLEKQDDVLLSTLRRYVEALGGRLRLVVRVRGEQERELDL